ncbi:DNA mismatch repair endonuclease MutL [Paenibacillus septentrionalis]|uniref:DNA mismatch repair protein MutL n=1 Tax=Paenibacillus septentrionalis TaxID=429342 RepID=A0ABW1V2I2_9BACL
MARIKLLDEQLANQIAAGEVVERPSSVVKELVENAIDASSTTIDVTIEEGGLTFIRVVDNGDGIEQEDLLTAFERHATSKISTSSDLFRIASLGFRGEALPSIAAVAKVECISSVDTSGLAHRIVIEGGKLTANEACNAPKGTSLTVRDLFFNTPARLKYMKTVQTELGHISDYMNRIALAHPGIAITLKHNGNVLLRTLGTGDRLQVIAAIYGTSSAKQMIAIDASDPDYELIGYISKPELTRANRNGITVIVNGRYIKSIACNHALLEGYHTLLPINRFPLAVLEIQMHPALLDVNVHPSKLEVRFSKEQELKALIEAAVREKLGNLRYTPGLDSIKPAERKGPSFVQDSISFHVADSGFSPFNESRNQPQSAASLNPSPAASGRGEGETFTRGRQTGNSNASSTPYVAREQDSTSIPKDAAERLYRKPIGADSYSQGSELLREAMGVAADSHIGQNPESYGGQIEQQHGERLQTAEQQDSQSQHAGAEIRHNGEEKPVFPELHWIGQHHGTYIIAQSEDGLYLIDQHAAHERINYEYYLVKFGQPQAASQQLLVPLTMEFTPGEAASLKDLLPYLEEAGVFMEPFGQQTYLVRAYPEWLPKGQEAEIVEEMVEYVLQQRKQIDLAKFREEAAIMCSCKASIKANDRMTREEGDMLIRRLAACNQPYTCPHGRPIIVHLSTYQLEKMFKRVMS